MLAETGMGTRSGPGPAGNRTGLSSLPVNTTAPGTDGGQFEDREFSSEVVYSGSDQDSDSGEDEDTAGSGGDRRGVKRERSDPEVGRQAAQSSGGLSGGFGGVGAGVPGVKPGKKTRGRVKIKMEFIDNKLRRYTTFSKRKTGIMKKSAGEPHCGSTFSPQEPYLILCEGRTHLSSRPPVPLQAYELSTLTGTQVLLLVASETGHVYTFATRKLQPMITSETGKALIQTCLNSPDSPPRSDPSSDQRMSATGFEETDLTYQVPETDSCLDGGKDVIKPTFSLPASTPSSSSSSSNGTVLKTSAGVVLPGGFTLMSGASFPPGTHTIPLSQLQGPTAPGPTPTLQAPPTQPTTLLRLPATVSLSGPTVSQQLQTIQVQPSSQQTSTNQSSPDIHSPTSSTAVSVVSSSSSSVTGHMMYPGGHTVMYATPTPSLGDGSLTVLNTFPPTGHAQSHDPAVPQVFLTSLPPVAAQIPVSAVQLHPMVISQQSSSNLTELQVVSLDVHQSKED
ncbi:serum response factor-like isoform X1 [Acanthochromis polyacanthus]|uniref:serum response factor-like isoform X1 n=1 Tax=Acanthochromis polyacanthus TaxID=80966 RepID=UPI0022346D17|nr:serum response factor-like isoform X1 [Acanthochromis polyacanthus]